MKKVLAMVLVAGALGTGGYILFYHEAAGDPGMIRVAGNIEATDVELSFKIPGRVEARLVTEGDAVQAGQVVARLDSKDLGQEVALRQAEMKATQAALDELEAGTRPEEIAQAQAVMQKSQALLDELLAGSRPEEIMAGEAALEKAKVEADHAKIEFDRIEKLYDQGATTTQQRDLRSASYNEALAAVRQAEANLKLLKIGPRQEDIEQARASLAQAKAAYDLAKNGPRIQTIEQARARLEQVKQSLGLAQTRLDYATLTSPMFGVVLSKNTEAGEYVSPGTPIVTAADIVNVWLRAYINETDLGRVKLGQRAHVTTDTYLGKVYEGRVSFISSEAEFTPKNIQTQKERVKLVYRIKIDIPNPTQELKPGMPADADILLTQDPG